MREHRSLVRQAFWRYAWAWFARPKPVQTQPPVGHDGRGFVLRECSSSDLWVHCQLAALEPHC